MTDNLHTVFPLMESFERPRSVPEALDCFQAAGNGARFLAGGTGLAAGKDPSVRCLIDLSDTGLSYIQVTGQACVVGATTRLAEIQAAPAIHQIAGGILSQAIGGIGSLQFRNRATLGGQLAGAGPCLEILTPLMAMDATVVLADRGGLHYLMLAGPESLQTLRNRLADGQLLVEVQLPPPDAGDTTYWTYKRLARSETDSALVNVAAGLQLSQNDHVSFTRIAVCGTRLIDAENLLTGSLLDVSVIEHACAEVARRWSPKADFRASAEYRKEMAEVLTERALRDCAVKAGWLL